MVQFVDAGVVLDPGAGLIWPRKLTAEINNVSPLRKKSDARIEREDVIIVLEFQTAGSIEKLGAAFARCNLKRCALEAHSGGRFRGQSGAG